MYSCCCVCDFFEIFGHYFKLSKKLLKIVTTNCKITQKMTGKPMCDYFIGSGKIINNKYVEDSSSAGEKCFKLTTKIDTLQKLSWQQLLKKFIKNRIDFCVLLNLILINFQQSHYANF